MTGTPAGDSRIGIVKVEWLWSGLMLIVVVTSVLIHYASPDGLQGAVLARVLGDDTTYTDGFSLEGFRSIRTGMSEQQVQETLGVPLGQTWQYGHGGPCDFIYIRNAVVDSEAGENCDKRVHPNMPVSDLSSLLGVPRLVAWRYTESRNSSHYRQRIVVFAEGRVSYVIAQFYLD